MNERRQPPPRVPPNVENVRRDKKALFPVACNREQGLALLCKASAGAVFGACTLPPALFI